MTLTDDEIKSIERKIANTEARDHEEAIYYFTIKKCLTEVRHLRKQVEELQERLRWRKYPEEKPSEDDFIEVFMYYDQPSVSGQYYDPAILVGGMYWRPSDYPLPEEE